MIDLDEPPFPPPQDREFGGVAFVIDKKRQYALEDFIQVSGRNIIIRLNAAGRQRLRPR